METRWHFDGQAAHDHMQASHKIPTGLCCRQMKLFRPEQGDYLLCSERKKLQITQEHFLKGNFSD